MRRRPAPSRPKVRRGADLHVHTTHSDGACSPGEVVRAAGVVGLSALAITDHDTLSALAVARPEADRLGIELISGIELTAERDGRETHILGHFFDPNHQGLQAASTALRTARVERLNLMVERLKELGLSIDLETLRRVFPRATLGRRHLAEYLTRTGQVAGHRSAFALYLGDEGPAQVPKPRLPWREAVSLIREAGGVAGLAHPPYNLRQQELRELAEGGLKSIEVAGPGHNARLGKRWRDWAEELALVPIAGSDFHAPDRPGRWVGAVTMSIEELDVLRRAANSDG